MKKTTAVVVQALYNRRCSRSSKPYAMVFSGVLLPWVKGLNQTCPYRQNRHQNILCNIPFKFRMVILVSLPRIDDFRSKKQLIIIKWRNTSHKSIRARTKKCTIHKNVIICEFTMRKLQHILFYIFSICCPIILSFHLFVLFHTYVTMLYM